MKGIWKAGGCFIAALILTSVGLPGARADSVGDRLAADGAEIYHTLEEKKQAGLMTPITDKVSLSGLLEVEAFFESVDSGDESESSSDLALATAQIGFEAEVVDNLRAALILLFEEGEDGIDVDEATLDYTRGAWSGRVGIQYLPFGVFPSHFVSDPLTLELGETRETAILIGYDGGIAQVSLFASGGSVDKDGEENHIEDWGASLQARPMEQVELGASYFSDLADSDAELVEIFTERTGGWSVYGSIAAGPFEVHAEFLGSAGRFAAVDLDADGNGDGDRPLAWSAEAAWAVRGNVELASRIEGSEEVAGQPELQYGACVSWGPWENVSLSLEYLRGEFDDAFGEGIDTRDLIATQLAVEF